MIGWRWEGVAEQAVVEPWMTKKQEYMYIYIYFIYVRVGGELPICQDIECHHQNQRKEEERER